MGAGFTYNLTPEEEKVERYDVSSGVRRRGVYILDTTNLNVGDYLPSFAPIAADLVHKTCRVVRNVKVVEAALANATAIKIAKGAFPYVGMLISDGNKSAEITAISRANTSYDLLTVSLGNAVSVDQVLFEGSDDTAGVNGVYTLTIGTNPTAGDKITINGIEFEFAAAPDEGKVVIGATASATASNLDSVLEQYADIAGVFALSYKGAKVVFTQKVAGTGEVTIVVTPVPSTGTLAATLVETTEGVAQVNASQVYVANSALYGRTKVENGINQVALLMRAFEIEPEKLVIPFSDKDKANLPHFQFNE